MSPGLLRHYYHGIDDLISATYRSTGSRVADALNAAVDAISVNDPRGRLLAFVSGSFREPVADPELLSTWLAFWSLARTNSTIARIHDDIYAGNRQDMERLISACPGAPADPRLAAIALTALVDGLWLELSLGNAPFSAEEAESLAEQWVATMLGPCAASREQQHR